MLCALCQPFVCPINEAVVVGVGGGVSGPAWLLDSILSLAVADARPLCLDTLARVLAFCRSADGGG